MTVRFIQRSIDGERKFFTGHYENLQQIYHHHAGVINGTFPNSERVQSTLKKQGFISLLDDEFKLEYRIEVDAK